MEITLTASLGLVPQTTLRFGLAKSNVTVTLTRPTKQNAVLHVADKTTLSSPPATFGLARRARDHAAD
eukprot:11210409-Lingulodinium_polyedra.AAC.1